MMISHRRMTMLILFTVALLSPSWLSATKVLHMNLEDLVDRSHKIFRGTVLDFETGSLQVGGGELPTVTYRLAVSEDFKGDFQIIKGVKVAEIQMVGAIKEQPVRVGDYEKRSVLPDLPKLAVGGEYLLFTTQPSAIGLSTTVGLGQGNFSIFLDDKVEVAQNEAGNLGLFRGMTKRAQYKSQGPISYTQLAGEIRGLVEGGKRK